MKRCRMRDYRCRPPKDAQREANSCVGDKLVLRLDARGRWAKDNGKPGLGFSAGVMGYYPDIDCGCFGGDADRCVRRIVMNKTVSRFSCANGRGRPVTRVANA
jgi:hypothetical protein